MIVEKLGTGFAKFAIIIEEKEEIDILYAALNAPVDQLQKWTGERWPATINAEVAYRMYEALADYRKQEGV